jgi:nucleotide-binding universal stress UspA family protein
MRRLLIALDGTDRGLAVLRAGVQLAEAARLEASVVTVDPTRPDEVPIVSARSERLAAKVDAYLRRGDGASGGTLTSVVHTRQGDIVREIMEEVAQTEADILVTGFHPGGPLLEVEEGSVSRTLVHTVPCAVMTVPV